MAYNPAAPSSPLPASATTPASLVMRPCWQWNLCDGADIANLISSPPAGTTWQASANLVSAARAGNVIALTHVNSAFDGVSAETNPTLYVSVDGDFDFVCRFRSFGNDNYENTGMSVRWSAGITGQWQARVTTLECYHNGASKATISITQDQWIWCRITWRGTIVSYYYSTSTAEPTLIDPTGAAPTTHWVRSYRESHHTSSLNGTLRLGLMQERVNGGATSGTYLGEFSCARMIWDA